MNIVDLFSGAGGLTFGFYYKNINNKFVKNEDNKFIFANEFDSNASKAFELNFPDINMICKDIKQMTTNEILSLKGSSNVDVIIGGPPCQSYSYVGKRIFDDKAKLYEEYLRFLSIIQPKMFVFENVKGILSMENDEGILVMDEIANKFSEIENGIGYNIQWKVLNAVDFGVPQSRERVFIIGIRKDLNLTFTFPKENIKKVTLKNAISDLPKIKVGECPSHYRVGRINAYQKLMRQGVTKLTYHFTTKHSLKLETVMKWVKQGEGKDDFNHLVDQGIISEEFRLTSGYSNTYGRLVANEPCTTITNNFTSPSCLRCIHYEQNRTLSLREGARIQSFPDFFSFFGTPTNIKKQIGNAVPPLMALEICKQIQLALMGDEKNGSK
ncbi:DNA cytosine methyltransferase [Thomasclavelia cocleata]|uniref:DNA cytosine methyltransferase n=1 Tax=Thomasclavelia cocleata TaxID=69824 RepID=UPI00258F441C|nr:DNA cytosine methyltransferase [Thomasclavelia cocleata]